MNILLFDDADCLDEQRIRVSDHRLDNLHQVQKATNGTVLKVGRIGGKLGSGTVVHIDETSALLEVSLNTPPPPKLPLVLIVALPRPKMLRRILRSVAEFGVEELHLVNSYRVEKSFWQTPVLEDATLRRYLLQGLEQSLDTVLPTVLQHRRFKPFAEDLLPALVRDRRALVAHPGEHPPCPRALGTQPALVAIGPEGGFIDYEVEKLVAAGCETVSLGARILRVENAVSALVARLY